MGCELEYLEQKCFLVYSLEAYFIMSRVQRFIPILPSSPAHSVSVCLYLSSSRVWDWLCLPACCEYSSELGWGALDGHHVTGAGNGAMTDCTSQMVSEEDSVVNAWISCSKGDHPHGAPTILTDVQICLARLSEISNSLTWYSSAWLTSLRIDTSHERILDREFQNIRCMRRQPGDSLVPWKTQGPLASSLMCSYGNFAFYSFEFDTAINRKSLCKCAHRWFRRFSLLSHS